MKFNWHVTVRRIHVICNELDYSYKTWNMNREALNAPTQQELVSYLVKVVLHTQLNFTN